MTRQQLITIFVLVSGLALTIISGGHVVALGQAQSAIRAVVNSANVGSGFTHQGFLQQNGNPVNDSCDFNFALFDAESGGNQVGATEAENGVIVSEGRFTVTLNDAGQFGTNAFAGEARWLEVAVRCPAGSGDFTTLSPRQPLAATPYALSLQPGATISGTVPSGILNLTNSDPFGAGMVVESAQNGLDVVSAGASGVHVGSSGTEGVQVDNAGSDGVWVGSAVDDGLRVENAFNGVRVSSASDDGLDVVSAGTSGVHVRSAGTDGLHVENASFNGLRVDNAGSNGVWVSSTGGDGLDVVSAGTSGVRVRSATNGVDVAGTNLAGYFAGNIQVTGSCIGCALSTFAINSSQQPLEAGAIVALQGSRSSQVDSVPLLLEVALARSGEPIVGVVQGRAELVTVDEPRPDELGQRLIPREGAAAPGEYVTIIIYGLAQVQAAALDGPIAAGDRLTIHEAGAVRRLQTRELDGMIITEGAPAVGIALEGLDAGEEGLIWVLVNPH